MKNVINQTVSGNNRFRDDYDVYLLDLDGTLIDSGEGIFNSIVYAFNQLNEKVPDIETMKKFVGPPLDEAFRSLCGFDEARANEAVRLYRENYRAGGIFECCLYEDVIEFLQKLKNADKKVILATSKPQKFAKEILEHFQIDRYFDEIVGSDPERGRTKKWQVIETAIEKSMENDKGRVVMVGDRKYDVIGAHSTNIKCIGVVHNYSSREEFFEAGADYIVDSLSAII